MFLMTLSHLRLKTNDTSNKSYYERFQLSKSANQGILEDLKVFSLKLQFPILLTLNQPIRN